LLLLDQQEQKMNKRRGKPPKLPGYTHEVEQAKQDGVELSTKQKERTQGRGQAHTRYYRWRRRQWIEMVSADGVVTAVAL
jgi:hypothetical protein